jgi:sugar lactone lactonase YvrE
MLGLSLKTKKLAAVVLLILVALLTLVYFYAPSRSELAYRLGLKGEESFLKGAFVLVAGGSKGDFFESPYALALDNTGNLYLSDIGKQKIFVFTRGGKFLFSFGQVFVANPPPGEKIDSSGKGFLYPAGLTVTSREEVVVVDSGNKRLVAYDLKGNFLRVFSPSLLLVNPLMITSSGGKVYLADRGCVHLFTEGGRYLGSIGQGYLEGPWGVAVDRQGNIYVADTLNFSLFAFSPSGRLLWQKGGEKSSAKREFGLPSGLAIDKKNERLFVADALRQKIYLYDLKGNRLGEAGNESGAFRFSFPRGLAYSSDGYLYVADTEQKRVAVFKVSY